jgi:hypothetical protein
MAGAGRTLPPRGLGLKERGFEGDTRASKMCRRLLMDMARVQGLNTSVAERLAPLRGRDDDDDDFDEVDDGDGVVIRLDDLQAHRARSEARVALEKDGSLRDLAGKRRSQEEMQHDVTLAVAQAR